MLALRAARALGLSVAIAACRSDSEPQAMRPVTIVPNLTGYSTLQLEALGAGTRDLPTGTFSYLDVDGAIDWYLFATHLRPGRAYRVLLTAADGKEYAISSRRAGADGSLGVHGVETSLMNRQCVGAEDPSRRLLASAIFLRVAVKSDGSANGASGNDMLGSRSALPCGGNGDGNFDYVLHSTDSVPVAR
ncbi:MAG: hypothetical protein ABI446_05405 [Gemmatimonadaceae bacterium]